MPSKSRGEDAAAAVLDAVVQVGKCVVLCRPGCNRPTVIQIGG